MLRTIRLSRDGGVAQYQDEKQFYAANRYADQSLPILLLMSFRAENLILPTEGKKIVAPLQIRRLLKRYFVWKRSCKAISSVRTATIRTTHK